MRFGCSLAILFYSILTIAAIITMTNIVLGAFVLFAGGLFCFLLSAQIRKHIKKIKTTQTFKIKDIVELRNLIKQEFGNEGFFSKPVAVQGTKKSSSHFEDDQFYVEDSTGKILVKLDHLSYITGNKPATSATFSIKNLLSFVTDNNRNPLLKDNEPTSSQILKFDGPVYVIGEACDTFGELMIKKPFNNNESFIVAFKSKKQYIEQKQKHSVWLIVCGIFLILSGISWITTMQTAMVFK